MEYAMNLADGRLAAFNDEVAKQTAYAHIPEDVAHAVADGSVDWRKVAELVHKKRNNDKDFSWEAFDALRDKQNIRRAKYEPQEIEKSGDAVPDTVPQVEISLSELNGKKVIAAKARDNVSSGDAIASSSEPAANAGGKVIL